MADDTRTPVERLLRVAALVEDGLLVVLLTAMVAVAGAQIVLRNLFDSSLVWADPLLRVSVLWIGMIGAMVATRNDKQISIDLVSRFVPAHWRARGRVITDLFTAAVSAVVAWSAYRLMLEDRAMGGMTIGPIPVWICEAVLPVAFAVIAFRYLLYFVTNLKRIPPSQDLSG
jgi:TRAP-type C4-dicarboxylate transport system permease small subunit